LAGWRVRGRLTRGKSAKSDGEGEEERWGMHFENAASIWALMKLVQEESGLVQTAGRWGGL
jgi:hypothetical protein